MRTDGLFQLHKFTVCDWKSGRTLRLVPFGDVHRDSPHHAKEKWNDFLEYAKGLEDAAFIGMGDYLDGYSTSERGILYNPALHESSAERLEAEAAGRIEALAKELEFMRGKIVGILGGNHYPLIANTTGDAYLAKLLSAPYLGSCALTRITFEVRKSKSVSVDIFAHHGRGGGTTATGKFMAVERMSGTAIADIFLMGDNHARGVFPLGDRLTIGENSCGLYVKSREAWIGRTGAFLLGYVPGKRSYVSDACMTPTNLGWIEFLLTPKRETARGEDTLSVEIKALQ